MAGFRQPGRDIKREFARTSILKCRMAPEYKNLIQLMRDQEKSTIISEADIVEFALKEYAEINYRLSWDMIKKSWQPLPEFIPDIEDNGFLPPLPKGHCKTCGEKLKGKRCPNKCKQD